MSEGLGTLAEEPKAIFFQKSKSLQAEFGLISLVTLREQLVEALTFRPMCLLKTVFGERASAFRASFFDQG